MPPTEAARHDLYTALVGTIGQEPTDTLMASLPSYQSTELLTKADLRVELAPITSALERLRNDMNARFDEVDRRFDEVDRRFDDVDKRFVAVDQRFASMDQRFFGIDHRLDAINQRIDKWWIALAGAMITIAGAAVASNVFG